MIAVLCPSCRGDTLWRYPNHRWARAHVPDLPPRCFVPVRETRPRAPLELQVQGARLCPDPFAHVETFKKEHTTQ